MTLPVMFMRLRVLEEIEVVDTERGPSTIETTEMGLISTTILEVVPAYP